MIARYLVRILLCASCVAPAYAQVFGGLSSGGTIVLSSFRGAETPAVIVQSSERPLAAATPASRGGRPNVTARAEAYRSMVAEIARELEVPENLLHAVIAVESAYVPSAVSPKGAQGLMQLMPETARRFGVTNPFDPRENVRGGALYLRWLLDAFGGDLQLALAGYNAGEQSVIRAGYRVPPYAETQRYLPRVMALLQ
jgi:soluble lytic murein transglycosylase-like protein